MNMIPMTEEHVPQIAELEAICFSDPWVEDAVRSELDNPLSYWLVAVEDEMARSLRPYL
jgi:ribosomal-protein-alanine N-acetyltransferase